MNALKPKPPFQVLVMSEKSGLGREQTRTQYALLEIVEAGVEVWFYLENQQRKMDTATDKLMSSIKNFGGEFERERTGQRTHDRLLQKARALHVVGCKVFGYDNVDVLGPDGTRQYAVRRINPAERAIVLRIFEMYCADGVGIHAIAKALNADGVPPPRGHRRGWAGTCVRAILLRPLYRGVVVWNKTKSINRGGTRPPCGGLSPNGQPFPPQTCGLSRRTCGRGWRRSSSGRAPSMSAHPGAAVEPVRRGPTCGPSIS